MYTIIEGTYTTAIVGLQWKGGQRSKSAKKSSRKKDEEALLLGFNAHSPL